VNGLQLHLILTTTYRRLLRVAAKDVSPLESKARC